jgi:serine/threonine-protein kinase
MNVTPANILMTSEGVAKLNDLMMTRALDGSVLQQKVLEKKFLAELHYLSPEQADPDAYVDDLCDLYRLGSVVYQIVTGAPPFTGDSPEEILSEIRQSVPEKPTKFNKHLPMELQAVILKMLAKHPEDRYATPAQLIADLVPLGEQHGLCL